MPCENRRRNARRNPESDRPVIVFLIGLPAAGKSTILRETYGESMTVINCDNIQATLPGAAAAIKSGCPDRLNILHHIAKPLTEDAVNAAIENRTDRVAYDSTGTGEEVADMATAAVAAGFDVTVLHVSVTVETSLARNLGRFAAGGPDGRLIAESIITKKAEIIEARLAALTRIEGVAVVTVDNNADRTDRAPKTEGSA